MWNYWILGATYAFGAAVQPGPLQSYLMSQAVRYGWRRTLPAALSPLLSDGPVILLVMLVLSRLPVWLIPCLRLAGGVFVLYLAFAAGKAWLKRDAVGGSGAPERGRESLLKAALVNVLNPGPYIAWSLVMGPLLLKGWRETPSHGVALVAGFYSTMVICQAGTIVLFASAGSVGPRVTRTLLAVSVAALAGFGGYLLWSGAAAVRFSSAG